LPVSARMKNLFCLVCITFSVNCFAQNLYFPPLTGNQWETISPSELGWCSDSLNSLIDYVGDNNSKAFIILKGGKIVVEEYFGTFTQDSLWYWASAGKSLTSVLVGIAQQQGLLSIDDPSSQYLGAGWTSCTPEQEAAITIRNQLSMNSGLDDGVPESACTLNTCLQYLTAPGNRWSYHNAPYTLLDGVIENAAGVSLNNFLLNNVSLRTGIYGLYVQIQYNNVFFSKARNFARFGLLAQNRGVWANDSILTDQTYFTEMVNPSQNLNQAYGYLWWLNGYDSFMLPQSQITFNGALMPDAPMDLFSGIGKDDQYVMVSPSEDMVVVRMGNNPDGIEALVPTLLGNEIWKRILGLACGPLTTGQKNDIHKFTVYPNPGNGIIHIQSTNSEIINEIKVIDCIGRTVLTSKINLNELDMSSLSKGIYTILVNYNLNQHEVLKYNLN
jgi:CubicO group peptidase (beta-lactamase class C family)